MRKVTRTIAEAFFSGVAKSCGNTCTDGNNVWLHGNKIAEKGENGDLYLSTAGWQTHTTKERLNGLLELGNFSVWPYQNGTDCPVWPSPRIFQKDFKWYISADGQEVPFPSYTFVDIN